MPKEQRKRSLDANSAFQLANACVVDEDFQTAIEFYNEAIKLFESDDLNLKATYLEKRSQCHIKLGDFNAALVDAEEALSLDPQNINAYLRKGTAMFEMDKFEGAKRAFEKCLEFDPNNARCKTWIRKCDSELDSSQTSKPAQQEEEEEEKKARPQEKKAMETERESAYVAKEQVPQQEVVTKAPTAKDRIKHNFYQINDQVVLSIIGLRNVAQDTRHVTIDTEKVDVSIDLPDGDKWEKTFELLYPVKPDESSFKHSPVKTEITLIKQDASIEWKVLEKSEAALKMQDSRDPKLFYPSSKGDKDWDGVEKEVTASLETEKPEGDAALNQLFQSIYSNASDEARRAMIKSFTESGGTVLSTNWEEVSQKRVEVSPPDGMEKRTWNEK